MAHARSYPPVPFVHLVRFARPVIFLIAALLTLSPVDARAQSSPSGRSRGQVVDPSGAVIARVPVSVIARDGHVVTTVVTDREGTFPLPDGCLDCRVRATLAGFTSASAALNPNAPTVLTLVPAPIEESVVVTATRDAAPTGQVAASLTVFDANAIARNGAPLVGDLLRDAPGATVVQSGGRGSVTSLFVRGGENNYTKVLLDGIPLNEPGGTFNFGGLSTGHLSRVEFIRGAQSALYGSDAMAGVLNLITARGQAGAAPSVAGELGAGSYGTWRGSATVSGGAGRFDYSLHGGRYETDNRTPNGQFSSTTVSLSAGGDLTPTVSLRLVGRYEDGDAGTPGQTAFGRPDLDASFTQSHLVGGLTLEHRASNSITQRITYALATSEQRSTNLQLDAPYTPTYGSATAPFEFYDFAYDAGSRFSRHQASYQADVRLTHAGVLAGAEFFTLAADWDGERGTLRDYLAGSSIAPQRNNFGATLQHQHLSQWVALTTGVRVEHNDNFGTAVVPRVSAALFLRSSDGAVGSTTLKANAGKGIKEPTLRQSFSLSPFDLGNPALDAERSRTLDVGIEQRLATNRVKMDVVWFDNRFTDQISTRTISFSPYQSQYFNVGLTKARGAEVTIDIAPTDHLRLSSHYTFTDSEIVDASSEFSDALAAGQWALRRPRHAGQVLAQWDRGRLSLDLGGTFLGRRNDSDFSSLVPAITSAKAYTVWRLQAQWRATGHSVAYVRVENLTDTDYMEPLGYPAWRRTVHAGLRIGF